MATKKKTAARRPAKKAAKRSAAKKATRRTTKKAAKKSTGKKRVPSAAFMKPMQPSAQLSAVVGSSPMPRTEVTKKLWQYIKRNGLQDAKNRRAINADDKLRPVFGGRSQVSMFDMTKMVNKHLS
jgi:upstream activation factor subunit UAF30